MNLLYIDPGTGSMLVAVLIGIIGALNYIVRMGLVKVKSLFGRGKVRDQSQEKVPFVIFSDNKWYWTVFEPICREFNERGIDVEYLTAAEDDPVFDAGYEHIKGKYLGSGNMVFAKLMMIKANVLLSTTPGLDVYQWKKSKEVDCYVHILHTIGNLTTYRMFGIDYYDAILLNCPFQETDLRRLETMRNLPAKETALVGIPYVDKMMEKLKNSERVEGETTVLLAPTWGPSGIFTRFGGEVIEELLKTGYRVIVRPHPQSFKSEAELMESLMAKYPNSDQLEWNRDIDNFEVLKKFVVYYNYNCSCVVIL